MLLLQKALLAISLVVTLLTAGFFVYTEFVFKKPLPDNAKEMVDFSEDVDKLIAFKTIKLKPIVTNLYSKKTRLRYLNLEIHVQPFNQKQIDEIEMHEKMLYDTIITVAGRMAPEDLNSLAGKLLFETRIKKEFNERFDEPLINKLFFSVFVIQ